MNVTTYDKEVAVRRLITITIIFGLFLSTFPMFSQQVEASVYDYEIMGVTRTGSTEVTVSLQVRFCGGCNPNDMSNQGCLEFTHGYPPPNYPYQYWCGGLADGRYVAVRLVDEAGNVLGSRKLVCNPTNWPLNQLVTKHIVIPAVPLTDVDMVIAEADVYCSWCGHWYPDPQSLVVGDLRVCIDAGHGGTDLGVLGWTGNVPNIAIFPSEKWVNLEIAQNLERLLEAEDFEAYMTRTTDTDVSLPQRCDTANNNDCDVFVSIHTNESSLLFMNGIVTSYLSFPFSGWTNSLDLAQYVQSGLVSSTGFTNWPTLPSLSYELMHTDMTATLTEVGFLTNKNDFEFLTNETQRSRIIETAEQQLGKPYVWGKHGPNKFDCSGLVYYSYYNADVNIPRSTAEAYYNTYCYHVDIVEELIPGDLLFVYTWVPRYGRYGIDHIGILTDRNTVIHASYSAGEVVEEPIDLSLWNRFGRMKPEYGAFTHLQDAAEGIFNGIRNYFEGRGLTIAAECPVDLIVTDPDGLRICKEFTEILGASYAEIEINGDTGVQIRIPDRKIGDYLIEVVPKGDALPTDTFTLTVSLFGVPVVIARNMAISDIPCEPYVVVSTETGIIPPVIAATTDFGPDVLNMDAERKYTTAYIELPLGYDITQIDVSSVSLNGAVPALPDPTEIGDHDKDSIPDLMVKFDWAAVQYVLTTGEEVDVTITGEVAGIPFEGSDTVRVINP